MESDSWRIWVETECFYGGPKMTSTGKKCVVMHPFNPTMLGLFEDCEINQIISFIEINILIIWI